MNLLYICRKDSETNFGGDVVQYQKTKEFLEKKYNCSIIILPIDKVSEGDIKNADILHIWGINTTSEIGRIINLAKKMNKKVIISSIFSDDIQRIFLKYFVSPFLRNNLFPCLEFLNGILNDFCLVPLCYLIPQFWDKRYHIKGTWEFSALRRQFIDKSDNIIPNSNEEGEWLCKAAKLEFDKVKEKFIVIPNAVDVEYIKNHKDTGFMREVKDFVIEGARIEPSKNQFGLLKALYNNPEIPIIFAGIVTDNNYFSALKKLAEKRGNVYFTDNLPIEDIFSLYKRAKVHVLPSFRETTGLSTLEALMLGTQIVVSNERFCPVKYYKFDEFGFVCNPFDINSIKTAVLDAYNHPKKISLSEEYMKFHSYENVADMTFDVYNKKVIRNL